MVKLNLSTMAGEDRKYYCKAPKPYCKVKKSVSTIKIDTKFTYRSIDSFKHKQVLYFVIGYFHRHHVPGAVHPDVLFGMTELGEDDQTHICHLFGSLLMENNVSLTAPRAPGLHITPLRHKDAKFEGENDYYHSYQYTKISYTYSVKTNGGGGSLV